jgi:hypothetical protein
MRKLTIVCFVLSMLCWGNLGLVSTSQAVAPPRSGQPYAENICNTDPNVILCEDFNYPQNLVVNGTTNSCCTWVNPGLQIQTTGFTEWRSVFWVPASGYPTKPQGMMPSGSQPDHVYRGNWDPNFPNTSQAGRTGEVNLQGALLQAGTTAYRNGRASDGQFYARVQIYYPSAYVFPGDPKPNVGGFSHECIDNKIMYFWPALTQPFSPTDMTYDSGIFTACGVFSPSQNATFADALAVRYGNVSGPYKYFPGCSPCSVAPNYYEYMPFQSLTLRNPNDQKLPQRIFRFNTNQWYTLEVRQVNSGVNQNNGSMTVWVDDVQVYHQTGLATCGSSSLGSCTDLGVIYLGCYHNPFSDPTPFRAAGNYCLYDNLVISDAKIGVPGNSGGGDTTPPLPPSGVRIQ